MIQLLNLQAPRYGTSDNYLNLAIQPLALGEPAELKPRSFVFQMGAPEHAQQDPNAFINWAVSLNSATDLRLAVLTAKNVERVLGEYTAEFLDYLGLMADQANRDAATVQRLRMVYDKHNDAPRDE